MARPLRIEFEGAVYHITIRVRASFLNSYLASHVHANGSGVNGSVSAHIQAEAFVGEPVRPVG